MMKQRRYAVATAYWVLMVFMISMFAFAQSQLSIILKVDSTSIKINNVRSDMDVAPYIKNDRTLVPIRFVSEGLNTSVYWFPETRQVKIVDGDKIIFLTIDSKEVWTDGRVANMDVPPEIVSGRTFVPLRFISEELGADVEWDGEKREISISR